MNRVITQMGFFIQAVFVIKLENISFENDNTKLSNHGEKDYWIILFSLTVLNNLKKFDYVSSPYYIDEFNLPKCERYLPSHRN